MAVALLALFVALDGPATAARIIDGKHIKRNSVTSKQIRNGSLGTSDLSRKARASLRKTPDHSIGSRHLQGRAVTGDKLADGAVDGRVIADGSITGFDLAPGLIGAGQLAPGAVTASKLAGSAVGADAIADGTLTTADVGDFSGAVQIRFTSFAANACQSNSGDTPIVPEPTAPGGGALINDDVIIVTPPPGWPDQLITTGNPGAGNTLRIIVCNPTSSAISVPAPFLPPNPPPTFRYLGIDQP